MIRKFAVERGEEKKREERNRFTLIKRLVHSLFSILFCSNFFFFSVVFPLDRQQKSRLVLINQLNIINTYKHINVTVQLKCVSNKFFVILYEKIKDRKKLVYYIWFNRKKKS